MDPHKKLYTLSIIAKRKNANIHQFMNKQNVVYSYERHSIEQQEVLIHATWRNLKNIMLRKSLSQKITYYIIPFICNVCNREIYRDRGVLVA